MYAIKTSECFMQDSAKFVAADPAIAGLVDQQVIEKQASTVATAIEAINTNTANATSVEVCTFYFYLPF